MTADMLHIHNCLVKRSGENHLRSFTAAFLCAYTLTMTLQDAYTLLETEVKKKGMIVLSRCIASLKSMTHAEKAKRALEAERLRCEIVNLDKNLTRHGCAYGLEFDCAQSERVKRILDRRGLGYGDILGRR